MGTSVDVEIRDSVASDEPAINALYSRAFPEEDLRSLVRDLVEHPDSTLSLAALIDSKLAGNIMFTKCAVAGRGHEAALLAPLAVLPECQRQGIGGALICAGLRRLGDEGISVVYVLGDPAYYGRHGFSPERSIRPPYPLPPEWADAWQSQCLGDAVALDGDTLSLPAFWLDPRLWSD